MKREDKIEWLKTHFFADFTVTRERVFNELSDMQPMFCICGGLATRLHERNCRKFQKAVIGKKGHKPVSPLDQDTTQDYATLMGNDIRELLQCDAVLFLDGWKESKGCRLENTAATIYGKERFYSLDKIPEAVELWHQLGKEEDNENFNL